jgi:two-component system, chemotaxis family, CheB/CheR fusion protein
MNKLREEGLWSGELLHHAKNGRALTVEAVMQVESVDGRQLGLQSVRDITERKAWEERQRIHLHDLARRLKNTLAVVQSIAHQTMRTHPMPEEFVARFDGRLAALGSAHDLLSQSNWASADLEKLVRKLLSPYVLEDSDRYRMEGAPIALPVDLVTSFGLVLHELATYASKYGALSQAGGTILMRWSVKSREGERILEFIWEEHGVPFAREPAQISLGGTLIETAIADSTVTRRFHTDGLVCTIQVLIP